MMLEVVLKPGTPVALPAGGKEFGGFRLKLSRVDGAGTPTTPPVSPKLSWGFGPMFPGDKFNLSVESVDVGGTTLAALPVAEIVTPMNVAPGTYVPAAGMTFVWTAAPGTGGPPPPTPVVL